MTPAGFPHSDIRGSQPACGSPRLLAACHVLPRLPAPRHPPCALTALDQFPRLAPLLADPRSTRPASPAPAPKALYLPTITHIVKERHGTYGRPWALQLGAPLSWRRAGRSRDPRTGRGRKLNRGRGCGRCDLRGFSVSRGRLTRRSRKEVIQPQVPLRLPCYDFAPVIELAFGRCLPCGLAHGLRALPTPMA